MRSSKALGEYLRFLRGSESQEEFSKKLGVHRTYISKAESGDLIPAQDVFMKWFEIGYTNFQRMQRYADAGMAAERHLKGA